MADFTLRASVRRVVEFALQSGDIQPVSMAALQAGTRGHIARQTQAAAHSERKVSWHGEYLDMPVEITGRIDILHESESIPLVEEIKLISPDAPLPEAPLPVHRMQAVCYAYMLCEECQLPSVAVQVSYVTEEGQLRISFTETLTHKQAQTHFFAMLQPFVSWEKDLYAFRQLRDATLKDLPFPYPTYRPGQRELAAQVYTAVRLQKRLFATLPTGTGKSAATLYPTLKALGEGKTRRVFYLTARGTAQQAAVDALKIMRETGLRLRSVVLTAKEKCCPMTHKRCHPDHCPRAKGYFDRERAGLKALLSLDDWTVQNISDVADAHTLCPFELSLSLCEIADVVVCDYNYVFDPAVHLQRIFDRGQRATLLIDEAHNLPARVRGMLGAQLSSGRLSLTRREAGKIYGRKSAVYKAFSTIIHLLRALPAQQLPSALREQIVSLLDVISPLFSQPQSAFLLEPFRDLLSMLAALDRYSAAPDLYLPLVSEASKEKTLQLLALDIGSHIKTVTRRMTGCVFFSATLMPLSAMKALLGGEEEDAVFALPSPFPPDNLLVLQRSIDTRYARREETAQEVAACILSLYDGKTGSYIAFFPSFAYLSLVAEKLLALRSELPLNVQERNMSEDERSAFLDKIRQADGPLLSLCVLGGVFSEGVDLPGLQLIGAVIVGVGLPQVNDETEALRRYYQSTLQDGFAYAYRYPGMHKVLQAAGRVIRSAEDRGAVLLLDQRYCESPYAQLLPTHYQVQHVTSAAEIRASTEDFWRLHGIIQ